jgi:phosphinothricin acetyltransferase
MGFEYFGTFKKVGYKLGKWKDVGWWQLQVNEYSIDPVPPIPFSKLNKENVRKILESSSRLIGS